MLLFQKKDVFGVECVLSISTNPIPLNLSCSLLLDELNFIFPALSLLDLPYLAMFYVNSSDHGLFFYGEEGGGCNGVL